MGVQACGTIEAGTTKERIAKMANSIVSAFTNALSGMNAQQAKMENVGNNISNMNTVGFKASRITFAENLEGTMGVKYTPFTQGTFQSTGVVTDLAITGDSFFVLQGENEKNVYTRAGNFRFDGIGRLVNPDGYPVMGYMLAGGSDGTGSQTVGEIKIDSDVVSAAVATRNVFLSGNINAGVDIVQNILEMQGQLTDETTESGKATAASTINGLGQNTTDYEVGDKIVITGTGPDGTAVAAEYTFAAGDTVQKLLTAIQNAFGSYTEGRYTGQNKVDVSIDTKGKIQLADSVHGDSLTSLNLKDADDNDGATSFAQFSASTSGFSPTSSTSFVVYDAQGGSHEMNMTFTKQYTLDNEEPLWKVTVDSSNGADLVNTAVAEDASNRLTKSLDIGEVRFNSSGQFDDFIFDIGLTNITVNPNNGAPSLNVNPNFEGREGIFAGITQFNSATSLNVREQDGRETGQLANFIIDPDGTINGEFTNGQVDKLAKVAVAKWYDPSGLNLVAPSVYETTASTGEPTIGKPEDLNTEIESGSLEVSNVDLADQFTKLIEAQRAFQAASKMISTLDEVLQETSRLKR